MGKLEGVIHAPILRTIAEEVLALIKNDYALRQVQGANAPRACYFDRQAASTTLYTITQARSGNGEVFTALVITFDTACGLGFYRVDGIDASTAVGVEIPAGGGILTIVGHDNIVGFSMIAQNPANPLIFARYLYK